MVITIPRHTRVLGTSAAYIRRAKHFWERKREVLEYIWVRFGQAHRVTAIGVDPALSAALPREFLDHVLFWNAAELQRVRGIFGKGDYNSHRIHPSLNGFTPVSQPLAKAPGGCDDTQPTTACKSYWLRAILPVYCSCLNNNSPVTRRKSVFAFSTSFFQLARIRLTCDNGESCPRPTKRKTAFRFSRIRTAAGKDAMLVGILGGETSERPSCSQDEA